MDPIDPALKTPLQRKPIPLALRVVIGVVLGSILGLVFGKDPYLFGLGNADLGKLGLLVVKALKALAIPLVLFAILDAFARTRISGRAGGRLVVICLVNVTVAMTIGLTIMNTIRPGAGWAGKLEELAGSLNISITTPATPAPSTGAPPATPGTPARAAEPGKSAETGPTLDPVKNLQGYVPESLVEPFLKNSIISVVLIGVLFGAALRRVKDRQSTQDGEPSVAVVERFIDGMYHVLLQALEWVIQCVPFAVFGVVADVVGKSGLSVFAVLSTFVVIVITGLAIHGLIYYPLAAWLVGRRSPREYLGKGADAILTGMSINSSLGTVPVTLRCLDRMGVSPASARLAACVGTNLNNDGITLYEAMAALFLAQALGMELSLGRQIEVVLASIMAGIGVAGVPEVGLIVLPLVLSAAGLPEGLVAAAIPLILPVDWIIARCRSGVNVMSDMLVAILLDATGGEKPTVVAEPVAQPEA